MAFSFNFSLGIVVAPFVDKVFGWSLAALGRNKTAFSLRRQLLKLKQYQALTDKLYPVLKGVKEPGSGHLTSQLGPYSGPFCNFTLQARGVV